MLALNRVDKLNALSMELIHALIKELTEIKFNPNVRGVLITGNGKAFSAGGDISEMPKRFGKALETKNRLDLGLNELVRLIRSTKVPVIAAVNGPCFGAGMVLAMACDVIYTSENAKFGFSHGNIGLIPESSYFMARYLGLHKAKELIFNREVVSAEKALEMGFINTVFPNDELLVSATKKINEWAQGPTQSHGLAKELLNRGYESTLAEHLDYEALAQGAAFTTEEHKEGVNAFINKRKPDFI